MYKSNLRSASTLIGFASGFVEVICSLVFYFVVLSMENNPTSLVVLLCGILGGIICIVASCFVKGAPKVAPFLQFLAAAISIACVVVLAMFIGGATKTISLVMLPLFLITLSFMVVAGICGLLPGKEDEPVIEKPHPAVKPGQYK